MNYSNINIMYTTLTPFSQAKGTKFTLTVPDTEFKVWKFPLKWNLRMTQT